MKKILVTGASGLLGSNICYLSRNSYKVYGTYSTNRINIEGTECLKLNITDKKAVEETIREIKPDILIHCAAIADMDFCEDNPNQAHKVHVEGTENLVNSLSSKSKFIYISTDNVYDGSIKLSSEEDKENPTNIYGLTKYKGELAVKENTDNYVLARTNIYGWNSHSNNHSFLEWIFNTLELGDKITIFKDVFYSPISVNHLSHLLLLCDEKNITGTYNISGRERISKLLFAQWVAEVFGFDSNFALYKKNI